MTDDRQIGYLRKFFPLFDGSEEHRTYLDGPEGRGLDEFTTPKYADERCIPIFSYEDGVAEFLEGFAVFGRNYNQFLSSIFENLWLGRVVVAVSDIRTQSSIIDELYYAGDKCRGSLVEGWIRYDECQDLSRAVARVLKREKILHRESPQSVGISFKKSKREINFVYQVCDFAQM